MKPNIKIARELVKLAKLLVGERHWSTVKEGDFVSIKGQRSLARPGFRASGIVTHIDYSPSGKPRQVMVDAGAYKYSTMASALIILDSKGQEA